MAVSRGRRMDNWHRSRFVERECGHYFSDLTAYAFGCLTCGPNGRLARMSVTHQLHLQLSPVNAALHSGETVTVLGGKRALAMEGVSVCSGTKIGRSR